MPDLNEDYRKIYELHARICGLMANPKRLEIIDQLSRGESSVNELAEAMGISKANVSQHLSLLRDGQLVTSRKDGQHVYYSLAGPKVFEAWSVMRDLTVEQLAAMDELRETLQQSANNADVEEITLPELLERRSRGEVVLVDVRPADEYARGHIEGAHS
ncbi:MAG: ArsR/SmtB family transcription factor, partial [Candidatus Bipolaricaulia bacterium]